MNKKIGMFSSVINLVSVTGFGVCMIFGSDIGSYFSSIFIALSFVALMCSYAYFSIEKTKLAGIISAGFATMYAVICCLVYFAQLTTVRNSNMTQQISELLDFKQFGLLFNYDMLGYALMSLSTFFAGLTIQAKSRGNKWLKMLLLIHGVFFISCFILPMLGLFKVNMIGGDLIGILVLEFWCIYFVPIGILSFKYFSKCQD